GSRTAKDSRRVEAYGTVDELNSVIGVVVAELDASADNDEKAELDELAGLLRDIQHHLFDLGGELCIPTSELITDGHIERIENELDRLNEPLPRLKEFILPGGSRAAAQMHLALPVCR